MKNLKNAVLTALMIFSLTSNVSAIFGSKKKGDTELHTAVRKMNLNEVVGILSQNPGLVNSQNNAGDTPLHVAVSSLKGSLKGETSSKKKKICLILLMYGASLDIKNNKQEIPLDSFIIADEFNRSYLNPVANLLLYFDSSTRTEFIYRDKMDGYFKDFIIEYQFFTGERLKNAVEMDLEKLGFDFTFKKVEETRREYINEYFN